jgi:serine/threonine protein kinase
VTTDGTLIAGRYRLDQPIGRGRAGLVWLAFDTGLHRTVAAKRLQLQAGPDGSITEEERERALREGRQAARVDHPSAITVHDAVADGPDVWLIMEYVPSRNMADFLDEHGYLTPEQAAFLGIQLGSALAAAHAVGVPHRVLQPGNVLLADDGGVKITDIGISDPQPDPAYQAPEVARGEPATEASDAFSLGATLFAAVEGKPPFGVDGKGEQESPHRAGQLTGALLKMLRSDPARRPTMTDTVASLRAITAGDQQTAFVPPTAPPVLTVPAVPAARPQQAGEQQDAAHPRRRRSLGGWTVTLIAVLIVVIVVIFGLFLL